jgi:hypothetical protein
MARRISEDEEDSETEEPPANLAQRGGEDNNSSGSNPGQVFAGSAGILDSGGHGCFNTLQTW